jgi:hypothetical protein
METAGGQETAPFFYIEGEVGTFRARVRKFCFDEWRARKDSNP